MTQESRELVNEKGLTRQEYRKRDRRYSNKTVKGVALGAVILVSSSTYGTLNNLITRPTLPETAQVYVDAKNTLDGLLQYKEQELAKPPRDFAYKSEELKKISKEESIREKTILGLRDSISFMEGEIGGMTNGMQAYEEFRTRLQNHNNSFNHYAILGMGVGLSLLIGSPAIGVYRIRRLGSEEFNRDANTPPQYLID